VSVSVIGCVLLAGVGWMVAQKLSALSGDAAFEVDGQVVTVSGYTRELAVLEALYGVKVPRGARAAASFRRAAAQAMAVQMIVARAAAAAGIHVTEKAAQDQLEQDVSQQYPQGFSSFASQLAARGLSEGEVRQAVSQEMVLERLFNRVVGTVHPSTAQLEALYRQHRAALAMPETRTIAHIVVSSRSEAQSILQQLQQGASFATLAAQDSLDTSTAADGGQLGTLSQSELTPAFGKAAFAAQVDVPFGPVHDADGWEIGLVTNVVPGHPTSFSQARAELEDYVVVRTEQARWTRWLDLHLRSAGLRFAAAYRPAHPDSAPRATLPTLGPPEAVGSVPTATSGGAASAQGASSAAGTMSAAGAGSTPSTSAGQ
jgi:parvulin-like peptidyl-prolyl isomerase